MVNGKYELPDTIFFGKYKGKTLQWIADNDIGYMEWLLNAVKTFDVTVEAAAVIDKLIPDTWEDRQSTITFDTGINDSGRNPNWPGHRTEPYGS